MDNKSAFQSNYYDDNVRKVIPFYDEIYNQIFDLIHTFYGNKKVSVLDTGCGSGTLGLKAFENLNLSEIVLCDPSEKMLQNAKLKLSGKPCEFVCTGSENLSYNNRFDIVTAIQSHHYFDRETRKTAILNCFKALKTGGIFIYFENTAPFSETGKNIILKRVEKYQLEAGRSQEEVTSHSARYGTEFFPITISEHLELLNQTGFKSAELFWHTYMQSGFYAVK